MPVDLSTDHQAWDGTEAVTLERVTSSSVDAGGQKQETVASSSVAGALRRALTLEEVSRSGGVFRIGDLKWHLPKTQVPTLPKEGDRIVDGAGAVFRIFMVKVQTLASRVACWTRRV